MKTNIVTTGLLLAIFFTINVLDREIPHGKMFRHHDGPNGHQVANEGKGWPFFYLRYTDGPTYVQVFKVEKLIYNVLLGISLSLVLAWIFFRCRVTIIGEEKGSGVVLTADLPSVRL